MSEQEGSSGELTFPLEFFLKGTPKSLQASSSSKERWKNEVREAARGRIGEVAEWTFLDDRPLALSLYYFPSAPMQGDIDNIVKPIMDALEGVAYIGDRVVERVVVQKFEPTVNWQLIEPSEQLARALAAATGDAFVSVLYIRLDDDLRWRRL